MGKFNDIDDWSRNEEDRYLDDFYNDSVKEDNNYWAKQDLKDANISQERLEQLSKNEDYLIRCAVAKHPQVSEAILKKLSTDENILVKNYVSKNTKTTEEVLNILSEDDVDFIRKNVCINPNTNLNILEQLSYDESFEVRQAIAENPKTSLKILEKLAEDENEYVREEVEKSFEIILSNLEITHFEEYYDIDAFRTEPLSNAIKELRETFEKIDDEFMFEPNDINIDSNIENYIVNKETGRTIFDEKNFIKEKEELEKSFDNDSLLDSDF